MKNDIDASITRTWNSGKGFAPIGNYSDGFKGSLDGSNHTVSGLFMDRSEEYDIGLFGLIDEGGIVKNLKLDYMEILGGNSTGGLSGENGEYY